MIKVTNLQKSFGDVKAVRGISFEVRDGEITGLLGPNGAGKTTTLRMLYSLLPPDQGEIRIDGLDPTVDAMAIKRTLGVVPDSRGLYTRMSARENIAYYGALHGMSRKDIDSRISELIETLDMADFIERRTEGFSQGQRVKVAIARAMVHSPQTVMMDEPSNGLDVMSTRALRRYILGLKAAGHSVVLSTHIMQEVAALCDRIIIIAKGKDRRQWHRARAVGAKQLRLTGRRICPPDRHRRRVGSMSGLGTIYKKEIRENLRDRRSLFNSVLLGPILFPILFIGLGYFAANKQQERAEEVLEVPVVGAEHAPNLVSFLKQQGVVIQSGTPRPGKPGQIPGSTGCYSRPGEVSHSSGQRENRP